MSKDFLAGRERALEDEFFHRVDQKLKVQLRSKIQAEKDCKQLAIETGIQNESVLQELVELGINPDNIVALSLVPLLQVAWADRIVEEKERAAILKAAEGRGPKLGTAGYQLLEHWLANAPGEKVLDAWKAYVAALCQTLGADSANALRDDMISHAREVAEAAGGILGLGAVSPKEEKVLKELEQAFVGAPAE